MDSDQNQFRLFGPRDEDAELEDGDDPGFDPEAEPRTLEDLEQEDRQSRLL